MKLLRDSCVGLAIVLGILTIVASFPTGPYVDGDGDGFGSQVVCTHEPEVVCVDNNTDCDDEDPDKFPGQVWYRDADVDGFGDPSNTYPDPSCENIPGYVLDSTDCDDDGPDVYPGAAEWDSDTECMEDTDEDGFGSDNPAAGVAPGRDCDDTDPLVKFAPTTRETCDGIDNNCDGWTWYEDDVAGCDRFTEETLGETVRDNKTGLIWLKNANTFGVMDWHAAMNAASVLVYAGKNDWRLPTSDEWMEFVKTGWPPPNVYNAAGDGTWVEGDLFTGVQSLFYWSSTEDGELFAEDVMLGDTGAIGGADKTTVDYHYVWPVHSHSGN